MSGDNRKLIHQPHAPILRGDITHVGTLVNMWNIVDVGAAFSQATLNENFGDLAEQLNVVITRLNLISEKQIEILAALKANCRAVK